MSIVRLAVRTVVGGLFLGHGAQMLKGWFGGPGVEGTAQMMESIDMKPPKENAIVAGLGQTVGGSLVIVGFATPLACASLIGTMLTAIRKVHQPKGIWNIEGGYEYNLVLVATLLELAANGPGKYSLDHLLGTERAGLKPALLALGLGVAGSIAAIEFGHRGGPSEDSSADG